MAATHGVTRQVCSAIRHAGTSTQASPLQVAVVNLLPSSSQKRYASTSTSRLPGSGRPSRVVPRSTAHPRHVGPSHTHRKTAPVSQEAESSEVSAKEEPHQSPTQQAKEVDTGATAVIESTGKDDVNDVLTPSTIEDVLGQDTIVVTREIEMMNIFLGFEQANKYALKTAQGESVGYLAESEKGVLGGSIQRQLLRNHRPFEAQILDTSGNVMMTIRRPFTFINSKVSIYTVDPSTKEEELVGEVHQIFHVIRRKYQLFVSRGGEKGNEEMEQFADIDEGLWAWDFMLKSDEGRPLGAISRRFRGFGRELFTDTGQYAVTFDPTTLNSSLAIEDGQQEKEKDEKKDTSLSDTPSGRELTTSGPSRPLTLQERAVTLATAISADFDYFSRHSQSSTGGFMPYFWMGGGSGEKAEPVPEGESADQGSPGTEAPAPSGGGGGFAGGDDGFGGGYPQSEPGPTADQAPPGDFGQGQENVWGKEDPWGEASPTEETTSGWGWGNNDSGGGGGGGDGGGGGWFDGFFDS